MTRRKGNTASKNVTSTDGCVELEEGAQQIGPRLGFDPQVDTWVSVMVELGATELARDVFKGEASQRVEAFDLASQLVSSPFFEARLRGAAVRLITSMACIVA